MSAMALVVDGGAIAEADGSLDAGVRSVADCTRVTFDFDALAVFVVSSDDLTRFTFVGGIGGANLFGFSVTRTKSNVGNSDLRSSRSVDSMSASARDA
jgi:hypothetical protein